MFTLPVAKVCTDEDASPILGGEEPTGFKVTGDDLKPNGNLNTDADTTTVTFANEDPENTEAVPMEVTAKIEPKDEAKNPTDDDVKVKVTVFPTDGTQPVEIPEDAVSGLP